ncbi:hypothetical protein ACHAWF_003607, partial [Thalassiosira exigua]
LDYIEVPNAKWYYSRKDDQLYEFVDGIFRAHLKIRQWQFSNDSIIKVLPDDAKVVQAINQHDHILCLLHDPDKIPDWQQATKTDQMEGWLYQVWQDESPPTSDELQSLIGEFGTSPKVEDLLEGDFDVDAFNTTSRMKQWLKWLRLTPEEMKLKMVNPEVSTEAFAEAYKVADKMTYCRTKMMSLPFMYGFAKDDVMLEKKEGIRKIHLMRIFGLVEAYFNMALQILFSWRLMPNAKMAGITPDQWGGCSNCSGTDCTTRKVILWEWARCTKSTVLSFFGDLPSCFDRMMPSLSSILAKKKGGMPNSVNECRTKTLRRMTCTVRTAAGTSTAYYRFENGDTPLEGEVQGTASTMCLWTLSSDSILNLLNESFPGIAIRHAAGLLIKSRVADAYVDDTDVYASADPGVFINEGNDPVEDLADDAAELGIMNLQQIAQAWTDIGHHMSFHKCYCQILSWYRNAKGYPVPQNETSVRGEIKLKGHNGLISK